MLKTLLFCFIVSFTLFATLPSYAELPNDSDALEGVEIGKAVFDINIAGDNPQKLALYLSVIQETVTGLVEQNVKPDILLAFRGSAVQLITTQHAEDIALDVEEQLEQVAKQLETLANTGVRMEACSVATRLFGVSNDTLLPNIKPVANTFVSLIGYQAKGYAIIPIY